jgi:hypothetical protein
MVVVVPALPLVPAARAEQSQKRRFSHAPARGKNGRGSTPESLGSLLNIPRLVEAIVDLDEWLLQRNAILTTDTVCVVKVSAKKGQLVDTPCQTSPLFIGWSIYTITFHVPKMNTVVNPAAGVYRLQ